MLSNNKAVEASEKLASIVNGAKPFEVSLEVIKLSSAGGEDFGSDLTIGDAVKIKFESTADGYLTLLDIGTSGSVHIIFPNLFNIDNFIRAGRPVYFPEGDEKIAAIIQGPPGIERIKAIFTKRPVNLFDIDFNAFSNNSLTLSGNSLATKVDKLIEKLEAEDSFSWVDAVFNFNIRAGRNDENYLTR